MKQCFFRQEFLYSEKCRFNIDGNHLHPLHFYLAKCVVYVRKPIISYIFVETKQKKQTPFWFKLYANFTKCVQNNQF